MPEADRTIEITRIEGFACRVPVEVPVATSFGVMRNRPAVFVRVEDADGTFGWGEAFANWPAAGAEHRVNLLADDVADLVLGRTFVSPPAMFDSLSAETRVRALQCGEFGPFRQVIAALDIAAWDLVARRLGVPLAKALSHDAGMSIPSYASGIHIDAAPSEIERARSAGFSAFKVKVGFEASTEPAKLAELAAGLAEEERLFADANQAWDCAAALDFMDAAGGVGLGWIEEPIIADAPPADWQALAGGPVPLAGGENIAGRDGFDAALALGALSFFQPDVAKWGGISGCHAVAQDVLSNGKVYCPHFLGGGIGLVASAHVLAATGGPGLLEVDVNPNPLRDAFALPVIHNGGWSIPSRPGLGIDDLPGEVRAAVTHRRVLNSQIRT